MQIAISEITIGERHRKDLGNLEELAASIDELGLLQPIGITKDKLLVFGERRLIACRDLLGWTMIPARYFARDMVRFLDEPIPYFPDVRSSTHDFRILDAPGFEIESAWNLISHADSSDQWRARDCQTCPRKGKDMPRNLSSRFPRTQFVVGFSFSTFLSFLDPLHKPVDHTDGLQTAPACDSLLIGCIARR